MYLFINDKGEITEGSFTNATDIVVQDNFFADYNADCYLVVDKELILKANADDIMLKSIADESLAKLIPVLQAKVKEIDTATSEAIVALAGDATAQSNKLAKSSQLIRKEALGTITLEEAATLDYLDTMFADVEVLVATGNDTEAQIMACTTTEEYEAKIIELGI